MATDNPIIEVDRVRRSFRSPEKGEGWAETLKLLVNPKFSRHEALKGVSFQIERGSFVGLIGANGAGKTTLLKILSGLIPASEGHVKVLGQNPFHRTTDFRKSIALVMGQKAQLWWDLPGLDAFDLLRAIYEIPRPVYLDRVKKLSELLGVEGHLKTQIRRLSLGERMKMELIGALLHWPQVIFLDEPTIGLDILSAQRLREFLKTFNEKEQATIILTSHNMDDIERLCSRVLILKEGQMIFDGQPNGLAAEGERRLRVRVAEKLDGPAAAQLLKVPTDRIEVLTNEEGQEGTSLAITQPQDKIVDTLRVLMSQCRMVDMGIEEPSLERVIQRLYSEGKL